MELVGLFGIKNVFMLKQTGAVMDAKVGLGSWKTI